MFTRITSFVVVFGILRFLSYSLWTLVASQITSIERAFGLSSSETGWILTVFELGYLVCTVFASYFGHRAHLTRVIGAATVICGISGFVFALPHFIAYEDSNSIRSQEKNETLNFISVKNLCVNMSYTLNTTYDVSSFTNKSVTNFTKKSLAFALFNIAMILQGAGHAPCYPYSAKYIDDNVVKQKTGFYMGIISSIGIFGLALGYGTGSLISKVYVTLEKTTISTTDSRYIGAWWLGFIIIGVSVILIAIPMFFFPRRFKHSPSKQNAANGQLHSVSNSPHTSPRQSVQNSPRQSYHSSPHHSVHSISRTGFREEIKRVISTLASIIKSMVYTLTLIGACLQILSFAVFLGFEPKYMETQFSVPSWQANIVIGVVSITSYSIGCLIGGFVTKKWTLTPSQNLQFVMVMFGSVTLMLLIAAFIGCEQPTLQNWPVDIKNTSLSLPCDCSATKFLPICGDDGNNYYSPCHAGCTSGTIKVLTNCSLIPSQSAKAGLCKTDCAMVWAYSAVKFVMNLVDATASIPMFIIFLRAAGEEHKALAIGLSAAVTSILAWLPGPVIGGKLIDSTCLIWNTAATSGKYCAFYDIEWLRYMSHTLMIGIRVAALFVLSFALYHARKLPEWPKPPEQEHAIDTEEKVLELVALNTNAETDI